MFFFTIMDTRSDIFSRSNCLRSKVPITLPDTATQISVLIRCSPRTSLFIVTFLTMLHSVRLNVFDCSFYFFTLLLLYFFILIYFIRIYVFLFLKILTTGERRL